MLFKDEFIPCTHRPSFIFQLIDKSSGYMRPSDNAMTIRIEWLQSQRLYQSYYSVYDDLVQTQKKQLA